MPDTDDMGPRPPLTVKVQAPGHISVDCLTQYDQTWKKDPRCLQSRFRRRKDIVMHTPKQYSDNLIAAVFSYEFVDDAVIERIHRGQVDD